MQKDKKRLIKLNSIVEQWSIHSGLYVSNFLFILKATIFVLDGENLRMFNNSPHTVFQQRQAFRLAEAWMISSI